MSKYSARFAELRDLEPGWHDGDGLAISEKAIALAELFIAQEPDIEYRIYPQYEGGVLIDYDYHEYDFSIEFKSNGHLEMTVMIKEYDLPYSSSYSLVMSGDLTQIVGQNKLGFWDEVL